MLQSFHIWLWYGHMTGTNTPPLCEDYRCVMDRSCGDLHAVCFGSLLSFLHWNSKIMFFLYLWIFEVHVLSLLFLHYLLLHLWGFFFLLWSLCWLEGDSCIALKLLLLNWHIWCIYMYNILSIKPNWKPIKPLPLYGGSCCEETIE